MQPQRIGFFSLAILLISGLLGFLPAQAMAEPKQVSDNLITTAVASRLFKTRDIAGYRVNVQTKDGIVTLTGTANNLLTQEQAARLAETVPGVRSVVNRIAVSTPIRPDEAIAENIQEALLARNQIQAQSGTPADEDLADRVHEILLRDPYVSPYDIEVSVVNGVVYLKGTVETSFEKSQAGRVTAGVYGVIKVINDLKVKNEPKPTTNL